MNIYLLLRIKKLKYVVNIVKHEKVRLGFEVEN